MSWNKKVWNSLALFNMFILMWWKIYRVMILYLIIHTVCIYSLIKQRYAQFHDNSEDFFLWKGGFYHEEICMGIHYAQCLYVGHTVFIKPHVVYKIFICIHVFSRQIVHCKSKVSGYIKAGHMKHNQVLIVT